MATHEQRMLKEIQAEIDDMLERIEELQEWAEDNGYPAIAHKLQEGRLFGASEACDQYARGVLTPKA